MLAIDDAIDRVREATGRDVHLAGYSQGGMFCYQTSFVRAIRRAAPQAEMYEVSLPTGHFGMIAGRTAAACTWPALEPHARPAVVRVVEEIPRTTWFRPIKSALRADGLAGKGDYYRLT